MPIQSTADLSEILDEIHRSLSDWELEVERSKKPREHYIATIGLKGTAAILQYNATVRIARLGADLLKRCLENRREGLVFGITQRPMLESFTSGMWFEFVAGDKEAKSFLTRSFEDQRREWTTLTSEKKRPSLRAMWDALHEKGVLPDTVIWMRKRNNWWNDSTHISARSVLMGWSNEYGEIIHNDKQVRNDLVTLLEIGSECVSHIHAINGESKKEQFIDNEKQRLRDVLAADFDC